MLIGNSCSLICSVSASVRTREKTIFHRLVCSLLMLDSYFKIVNCNLFCIFYNEIYDCLKYSEALHLFHLAWCFQHVFFHPQFNCTVEGASTEFNRGSNSCVFLPVVTSINIWILLSVFFSPFPPHFFPPLCIISVFALDFCLSDHLIQGST